METAPIDQGRLGDLVLSSIKPKPVYKGAPGEQDRTKSGALKWHVTVLPEDSDDVLRVTVTGDLDPKAFPRLSLVEFSGLIAGVSSNGGLWLAATGLSLKAVK